MERQEISTDVIVIGGGTSGMMAAYSALREGLSVAIVEKALSLGGSMTNGLVTPMMPTAVSVGCLSQMLEQQLEKTEQKVLKNKSTAVWFQPEVIKEISEDNIAKFAQCTIIYDALCLDAVCKNKTIQSIDVISFNQRLKMKGKMFIDATGDAWLARLVGIPTSSGDEDDGVNQSTSFRFEIGNVDINRLMTWCRDNNYTFNDCESVSFFEFVHVPKNPACGKLLEVFARGVKRGALTNEDIRYIQGFAMPGKPHTLSFNGPQLPNIFRTTDPLGCSQYVITGRKMQRRLFHFLKEHIPGFEQSFINQEARMLGIRESYRIKGIYTVTEEDYLKRQKFTDGIAKADWYVDVHSDDMAVEAEGYKIKYRRGEYFEIPYRCLITKACNNYLAVGRHISASFKAQSSIRIQKTCQDIGEAAGIACGYALKKGVHVNDIDMSGYIAYLKEKREEG